MYKITVNFIINGAFYKRFFFINRFCKQLLYKLFGTVWNSVAEPFCGTAFCVSCWQQLMCTNNNYFNFIRFLEVGV